MRAGGARRRPSLRGAAALAALLLAAALAAAVSAAPAAAGKTRWVGVSVATLWVEPGEDRAVDAPSVEVPADPRAWVRAMSVAQKRWLVGRLETQALLGDKVTVLATSGSWSKVAVAGQPTPRDARGYPGWLPTAQLTAQTPQATQSVAVVTSPAAWLFSSEALKGRVVQVSYATRLPVLATGDAWVRVAVPGGEGAYVARAAVTLRARGARLPAPGGAQVVAEARRFLGLQYLWAGTSGFGFDCSGYTYSVFRVLGVTIPRDAGPQSSSGAAVRSRGSLRAGDLVFFRNAAGDVHHVGICVGGGRMIHAPGTGRPVAEVSLSVEPYASEFAGGRRLTR